MPKLQVFTYLPAATVSACIKTMTLLYQTLSVTGKQLCQRNSFYHQLALMERGHKISTWPVGTRNGLQNYQS